MKKKWSFFVLFPKFSTQFLFYHSFCVCCRCVRSSHKSGSLHSGHVFPPLSFFLSFFLLLLLYPLSLSLHEYVGDAPRQGVWKVKNGNPVKTFGEARVTQHFLGRGDAVGLGKGLSQFVNFSMFFFFWTLSSSTVQEFPNLCQDFLLLSKFDCNITFCCVYNRHAGKRLLLTIDLAHRHLLVHSPPGPSPFLLLRLWPRVARLF